MTNTASLLLCHLSADIFRSNMYNYCRQRKILSELVVICYTDDFLSAGKKSGVLRQKIVWCVAAFKTKEIQGCESDQHLFVVLQEEAESVFGVLRPEKKRLKARTVSSPSFLQEVFSFCF